MNYLFDKIVGTVGIIKIEIMKLFTRVPFPKNFKYKCILEKVVNSLVDVVYMVYNVSRHFSKLVLLSICDPTIWKEYSR